MSADTTKIEGNGISELCLRYARMLNLDIYENVRAALPRELHPAFDIVKNHWVIIWEYRRPDGFLARICAPAATAGNDAKATCPPVLIFRGSDSESEDFAELAGAIRIN